DLQPDEVLLTADTVVILDGDVIGKPVDADDARRILNRLQGRTHTVVTGVTVAVKGHAPHTFSESTDVEFSPLTPAEIDYYVSRYSPLDKAGAYGIQEWIGAAAVKGMKGSFYNVMGLPVNRIYRELKNWPENDAIIK
ncbi:MAG: Maf family protein, partial [Muribaculaceae bacterium]|nr:Maf family protein [Muribaculaceae bacterium]